MNKKKTDNEKENVDDKDKEETKGIQNFIDMQAFTILLHLSGNPKTRSEMVTELKEIPIGSLYRKIINLEKSRLIKPIILSRNKKRKRNNIAYETISRNFVITDRGKSFRMSI